MKPYVIFALALCACGSSDPGSADGDGSEASSSAAATSSGATTQEADEGASESTLDGAEDTSEGGFVLLDSTDGPCSGLGVCDIWPENDCAEGQKCVYAACGGPEPDSTVCVDIVGEQAVGEPCERFDDPVNGVDDCELGAVCWNVDAETGEGWCRALCRGTPTEPSCPAESFCLVLSENSTPHCIPTCDPLVASDCSGSCFGPTGAGFECDERPPASDAPYASPCETVSDCNPGLVCLASAEVGDPSCAAGANCCTPYCDLSGPETCPGVGQVCEPWLNSAEQGFPQVGVCRLPEAP